MLSIRPAFIIAAAAATIALSDGVNAQTVTIDKDAPVLDTWLYPPGVGPFSPFAVSFASPFDTDDPDRLGYAIYAFDLTDDLDGLDQRSLQLTQLTINIRLINSSTFDPADGVIYDPTLDPLSSYTGGGDPDPGRPIELYALEFANGFDAESWLDANAPTATGGIYNAQPIDLAPDATPRNVLNSVDDAIETNPFAVATTNDTYVGSGGTTRIADNALITFDIDLTDPDIEAFWREQLFTDHLIVAVSSLHAAGFAGMGGEEIYPRFGTLETFGDFDASATIAFQQATPSCPADLNDDEIVDAIDLGVLLGAFANSDGGDLNGDGITDAIDLGILLGAFGQPCN